MNIPLPLSEAVVTQYVTTFTTDIAKQIADELALYLQQNKQRRIVKTASKITLVEEASLSHAEYIVIRDRILVAAIQVVIRTFYPLDQTICIEIATRVYASVYDKPDTLFKTKMAQLITEYVAINPTLKINPL